MRYIRASFQFNPKICLGEWGVGWTGQLKCSDAPCGRHGVGVGIVDIPPFGLNGQCSLVGVMELGLWISLGNGVGQSSGILPRGRHGVGIVGFLAPMFYDIDRFRQKENACASTSNRQHNTTLHRH